MLTHIYITHCVNSNILSYDKSSFFQLCYISSTALSLFFSVRKPNFLLHALIVPG